MLRGFLVMVILSAAAILRSAHADIPVKEYARLKEDAASAARVREYIAGVGKGMLMYSIYAETKSGIKPLFCVPGNLALNEDNYQSILDGYLAAHKALPEGMTIEILMIYALIEAFPCKK